MSDLGKITVNQYNEWVCACGNDAAEDGFDACTRTGVPVTSGPNDYSACMGCLRIIRESDATVVGYANEDDWKVR